jgi:glycosyltransferase involved in cell wall biosynthesis
VIDSTTVKVLVSFPGLHRVPRGAEVALEAIAGGLADAGDEVLVVGSGPSIPSRPYRYNRIPTIDRERFERWPKVPPLREAASYESLLFNLGAAARVRRRADVTLSCGFPWDNLFLRRPTLRGRRPPHVFITENGDWPARIDGGEARLFGCEGLVCTNPVYFEDNRDRWRSALIPNGVDVDRFTPGPATRRALGLPDHGPIVLMASALIPSKRVDVGIRAVAEIPDAILVVAGSGPMRPELDQLADRLLGSRYICRTFPHEAMPALYRSADLLLHLSEFESFGNVYIEALATGLPVVAHTSPVTTWILGDDGVLIDTTEEASLVAAIGRQLQQGRDAGGTARRERAMGFAWPAVAAQYHDFLAEVAGAST